MKLTFLGTSAGKPTNERNVSALGMEFDHDSKWVLFDCGEGTQRQILYSKLSLAKLNTIFITHLHGDHYYGLPGLLSVKKLDKSFNALSIYGPSGMREFLECTIDISKKHLGYDLEIIEYACEDEFLFDKFSLKVLPLIHSKKSVAFYIKENALEGKNCIIAGDNAQPNVLDNYLENLDLLVHECTFTQEVFDRLETKFMHTTAKDLAKTAQKKHVTNLIANHISPRYCKNCTLTLEMIYDEIKSNYDGKFFIANDFDVYYLGKEGLKQI